MGKASRDKGERAMREVAEELQRAWPEARKHSQYRGAVVDGCDIEGTPYWVEVKRRRAVTIAEVERWLCDAETECDSRMPIVVFRGDKQPWRAAWWLRGANYEWGVQLLAAFVQDEVDEKTAMLKAVDAVTLRGPGEDNR